MYALEILPRAVADMTEIVRYISHERSNLTSAAALADEMIETAEGLCDFPYANPLHQTIRPLGHEYRRAIIRNYRMFYWVDERSKTVTVARVIYGKRDYPPMPN